MRRWVMAGLMVALGLALPPLFHVAGLAGSVFLPMHLPVLLAGLLLGPAMGAVVGCVTPALSFMLTGMPPGPVLLFMIPELMVYGAVSGWLYQTRRLSVWIGLAGAMIAGRLAMLGIIGVAQATGSGAVALAAAVRGLLGGWPGILVQLALVPPLVRALPSRLAQQQPGQVK